MATDVDAFNVTSDFNCRSHRTKKERKMNAFDWSTGDDFSGGGSFLEVAGKYHMVVTDVAYPAVDNNGGLMENGLFNVTMSVLAGSVPGTKDKTLRITFFKPNMSSKDGGKFARKKVDRFLLAVGLVSPGEEGIRKEIDITQASFRQLLVELDRRTMKYKDKKTGKEVENEVTDIKFSNIFHVDDPDAADYPRDMESINLIPSTLRRIGMDRVRKPVKAASSEVDSEAVEF